MSRTTIVLELHLEVEDIDALHLAAVASGYPLDPAATDDRERIVAAIAGDIHKREPFARLGLRTSAALARWARS